MYPIKLLLYASAENINILSKLFNKLYVKGKFGTLKLKSNK